jgi:hypothetical protein
MAPCLPVLPCVRIMQRFSYILYNNYVYYVYITIE